MKQKNMFVMIALAAVIMFTMAVFLTACGGGGGGGAPSGPSTVVTSPSTTTQAKQAASSGTQGVNMGAGSSSTFQNFGNIGLTSTVGAPPLKVRNVHKLDPGMAKAVKLSGKFSKSKAVAKAVAGLKKAKAMKTMGAVVTIPTTTGTCTDGGTYSYTGTVDDTTFSYTLTFTTSNCREGGTDTDGTLTLTGTGDASGAFNFTEQLGTDATHKLTILEFSDSTYTLLLSRMETLLTLGMSGTFDVATSDVTLSFNANGSMDVLDYINLTSYDMTFTNNKFDLATSSTATSEIDSFKLNGSFSESWTDAGVTQKIAMSYVDFMVSDETNTSTFEMDESISGKFGIDFTPDNCFEAGYSFVTVTPIHYNAAGMTTAGELIINTTVDVVYNSDGTITVTISGATVYSGDEFGLATVCEFQTLDEPAPVSSGSTGTATGNTMTVTSKSANSSTTDGIGLDCFTDVHVNFYSTQTPTVGSATTWYIDWNVSDTSTVPAGSGLQQYLDIDADGIADVGLDINGYQVDSTSGGLEHFSAYKLPSGYYVISMNNYSCPTTVSNTVNIQIGNDVFGPYLCNSYSTSDGEESHILGAWCAVADVVVDSSGNATVQAHNTALPMWDDLTLGAPSLKKARGMK